ncbi:MAG: prolyl oligopeptidase family serine peptidase [Gemmatimonadales bacterium]|nr:MAG: prolyl oligopeptidase family serine peptidase [Gemmatimonadales bacterium]
MSCSAMVRFRPVQAGAALTLTLALLSPWEVTAQTGGDWDPQAILAAKHWVRPPEPIQEAVLAPRYLNANLTSPSPDGAWFAETTGDGPVTMDRFSRPFDELGGLFIDVQGNRHRNLTIRSSAGIALVSSRDGSRVEIRIPEGARVSNATWSPDGSQIAFFVHTDAATHIHVADPTTGRARQVTRTPVLATLVTEFQWTADGREIATVLVPADRSPRPQASRVPAGPQVKQTMEGENMLRTYASLMATPHDEALLEWHGTGQLVTVNVENRRETRIGGPTMVWSLDFAADGQYAMVESLQQPFSYIVPVGSFGRVTEIWDRGGNVLAQVSEREMSVGLDGNLPSAPGVGGSEEAAEKRQVSWREDGQGLTFLQQEPAPEDEEEPESGQEEEGRNGRKDRVMQWLPPFDEESLSVVYENGSRMSTHRFSPDYSILFAAEGRGSTTHEFVVFLDDPETRHTLFRYNRDDFYENPGSLVMTGGSLPSGGFFRGGGSAGGTVLVSEDGEHAFLYGTQYSEDPLEEAPSSFLDRVALRTGEKERVFEGENDETYEALASILDVDEGEFVVSRESPTQVPQYYRRTGDALVQLTENVDYTPDITNAPRHRFVVTRPDGFRFLVNVTLPQDYEEGTRLPAMFWFYPREYTDQESYDERGRTYNKNAFQNFGTRSIEYLIRLGYAVVEPDAPIVGDEGQMNNNYEHDLRNNLAVVIDSLDARGIIDRGRLGLGGHSYGAFSTLNAMVHTPFFKAGIAGDGNYNRTFTPLRFQSERRIFWDAKDVYLGMSPFMFADELTGAVLLYHGLHDQNVGTAPEHSPRLFHALNGLGKDAAMYLYPFEDHGPATRETLLDLWARWTAWLHLHLGDPRSENTVTQDGAGLN